MASSVAYCGAASAAMRASGDADAAFGDVVSGTDAVLESSSVSGYSDC